MTSNSKITPTEQKELNDKLLIAVKEVDIKSVEELIKDGADVNYKDLDYGETPLHKAIDQHYFTPVLLTIVEKLIENRADVNAKNNHNITPLHKAAHNGHLTIVKYLMEKGAYFNVQNNRKKTPLTIAREENYSEMVTFLEKIEKLFDKLKKDALTENDLQEIQNLISENKNYLNTRDYLGNTPLHYAIEKDRLNLVIKLINEGASIDIKNQYGYTPLGSVDIYFTQR